MNEIVRFSLKPMLSAVCAALLFGGTIGAEALPAQARAATLPFSVGEELEYRVKLGSLGGGHAEMRVDGPVDVRGHEAWVLSFDVHAKAMLARVHDESRSWLDPQQMTALRYLKREDSPLSSHREAVEIYPDQQKWTNASGRARATPSNAPLDELSFIYYIRTLPLRDGDVYTVAHHFDAERNPVVIRVRGRERVSVPAGTFPTIVVEMKVHDPRRYGGTGTIRFHLSDDAHRIPVRMESPMPVVGTTVLTLERWAPGVFQRSAGL